MRTPEDSAKEFLYAIKYTDSDKEVERILEFESEIRADQDKITRHACADSILSVIEIEVGGKYWIDRDAAIGAIINTKAI